MPNVVVLLAVCALAVALLSFLPNVSERGFLVASCVLLAVCCILLGGGR